MNPPRLAVTALAGSAILAFAAPSSAQRTSEEVAWSAWHGCWHAEGAPATELLCIVPDGAGVRMITVVDGAARGESRVVADDRVRDVVQDDCRGTETARWSADRRRVFLNAQLTCGELRRFSSGMLAFTDPEHWISVQSINVDGQTATRSTMYELARSANVPMTVLSQLREDGAARSAARYAAAGDVSDADVTEAAGIIDDAAVQEWLHAAGAEYDDVASGSALDQLDRGYAGTEVIERPVYVDRPVYVERTYVTNVVRRCWDPFFGGFVVGVSRHVAVGVNLGSGCGYHYYTRYSPWGYDLYGWHSYRPTYVINRYPRYVRNRPIIIPRDRNRYGDDNRYRDRRDNRYRDDRNYRDGRNDRYDIPPYRDTRSYRDDRDRPRVTPNGYTQGRSTQNRAIVPPRIDRGTQTRDITPPRIDRGTRDVNRAIVRQPRSSDSRATQQRSTTSRTAQPRQPRTR